MQAEELQSTDFLFLPLLMEECSPVIPHHLLGLTDVKGEVIWLAPLRQISLGLPTDGHVDNCCAVGELRGDSAGLCGLAQSHGSKQRTKSTRGNKVTDTRCNFLNLLSWDG